MRFHGFTPVSSLALAGSGVCTLTFVLPRIPKANAIHASASDSLSASLSLPMASDQWRNIFRCSEVTDGRTSRGRSTAGTLVVWTVSAASGSCGLFMVFCAGVRRCLRCGVSLKKFIRESLRDWQFVLHAHRVCNDLLDMRHH